MKIYFSGFVVVMITFLSSCSPVLYSNTGHVVPLFQQKGEVMLNASVGSTEDATGVGAHFAAALDSSWAIIASYYYLTGDEDNDSEWRGNGSQFDFGGGKFYTFGEKNRGVVELFAGVGFATITNRLAGDRVDLSYVKPFIQPSIGVTGPWVDFAFTPRIAVVSYTKNTISLSDGENQLKAERYFREKKSTLVFEPGMIFRAGYKNIKGQILINLSTFRANGEEDLDPNINDQYVSVGINYLFPNRYR